MFAKLGFCSECSQNFSGFSFARVRVFLQVLACSVFRGGKVALWKVLVARKANVCHCLWSQSKTLCSYARKCSQRPFDTPRSCMLYSTEWLSLWINHSYDILLKFKVIRKLWAQHKVNVHIRWCTLFKTTDWKISMKWTTKLTRERKQQQTTNTNWTWTSTLFILKKS